MYYNAYVIMHYYLMEVDYEAVFYGMRGIVRVRRRTDGSSDI